MITLFDHNEPNWHAKYSARGRENGAATYSREIVKYQYSVYEEMFKNQEVIISTCALLSDVDQSQMPQYADIAFQYLHSYPYGDGLAQARKVVEHFEDVRNPKRTMVDHVVFVTAYKPLHDRLVAHGYQALFLPMTVDTSVLPARKEEKKYGSKNIVYFGNVTNVKEGTFIQLQKAFKRRGWSFNYISNGKLAGIYPITQHQAWERINDYSYGIGVGRCALEMMAMGLKTMIAGPYFGGIMTNEFDFSQQQLVNMNGRIVTFDREIDACIDYIQHGGDMYTPIVDSQKGVNSLAEQLELMNRSRWQFL